MKYCCDLFKHHLKEEDITKTNYEDGGNYYIIEASTGFKLYPVLFCPFCGANLNEM
jgi:hypothetical protein